MDPRPSSSPRSPDAISGTKRLRRPGHTIAVCPVRLRLSMHWLPAFTRLQRIILLGHVALQLTAWTLFRLIWSNRIIAIPLPHFFPDVQSWYKPLTFFVTAISSGWRFSPRLDFLPTAYRKRAEIADVLAEHASRFTFDYSRSWTTGSLDGCIDYCIYHRRVTASRLFDLDTKISSKEVDLANPRLDSYFYNGSLDACVLDNSVLVGLAIGETESGFSAARGAQSVPSSLSIANFIFNTSTADTTMAAEAGILPLSFQDIPTSSAFDNATVIPHLDIRLRNWDLVFVIRGFTADVSCKFQTLTNTTIPSLTITTISPNETSAPTQYNINSNCPMPAPLGNTTHASTYALAENDSGYLLMIACANGASYSLIFIGGGDQYAYLNSTVWWTTTNLTSASSNTTTGNLPSARIDTTTLPGGILDFVGGSAGVSAVATVYEMIRFAQGEEMNVVGDQLIGVLEGVDGEGFVGDGKGVLTAMEEYLRGAAEYSGTLLRACLSSHKTSGIFADGIPKEISTSATGELRTYFFGWALTSSTVWILIPGALIAFASIVLVLTSAMTDLRLPIEESGLFDPVDAFELMRVSAAGGLVGVFDSEDGGGGSKGELGDARVMLEMIPGREGGRILGFGFGGGVE
ncbi:hypothetical protein R3P38DRAFT_3415108 [Favolaschia claudopus]|uniref:Uncharacterized protein n=1 Tax=Favolaschia claudopus TaxID=2862362 RepID=A0AAW0EF53_9AGAR